MKRVILCAALLLSGCSVKKYAINRLGDALAGTGTTFARDDDPELIRGAVPFSLKLVESLLAESPRHPGLLLAASRGFTQYSFAYVVQDADELADADPRQAKALRDRAVRLYMRARDYGMRGLELKHPEFSRKLKTSPAEAVQPLKKGDVPFAYWTAISWAAALAVSRDLFMLPQMPQFEALVERSLELDESYDQGVLHSFLITYDMNRLKANGDKYDLGPSKGLAEKIANATHHFDRAVDLARGRQAGPYVSFAESVLTAKGDRAAFVEMLNKALKINVDADPDYRLLNLVMQRRARWLLARADKLFPKK